MITCVDNRPLFRNPKPHLRALNAWHPSLVNLGGGELLASFDLGQAAESLDYRTYVSRSTDGGTTWTSPQRLLNDTPAAHPTSHTLRTSRLSDGSLVAFGAQFHRDDPEEGLTNRENLGFVPLDLILLRSRDRGRSWDPAQTIEPPLVGPAFEVCHSIVELSDGRWLAPTSTWRRWDGHCPNGMKAVALVSRDRGKTWPAYLTVMDAYAHGILHLEQSLVELPDRRLLAVAWAFDERCGTSREIQFAFCRDGQRFEPPQSTGLHGETCKVVSLGDDRILCVYRRTDQPGLWAAVAQIGERSWRTLHQEPIWQGGDTRMFGQRSASDELAGLKAGYPSLCRLENGQVLVAFWCCQDAVYHIRLARLECRA